MTNWLLEQQLIMSFLLLILMFLEAQAMKKLGAKMIYTLWLLVPLLLMVNNFPQDVISVDDQSIYRYIVEMRTDTYTVNINLNWALLWLSGSLAFYPLGHLHSGKFTA